MSKWLRIALAKHVLRYKEICRAFCYEYKDPFKRMVAFQICMRLIKMCDPRLETYHECIETALKLARSLVDEFEFPKFI